MIDSSWYKKIWTLDIKNMSWTENTVAQVDFLMETMGLTGRERVLDLACGYGRHALELARRGCEVVGVDITPAYMEDANQNAKAEGLKASFILSDLRDVSIEQEFDVVLNLADGAIGYLESDEENLKIFDVISRALKPGGKHLMDVCNADHARRFFPKRWWEIGEKGVSLPEFTWDEVTKRYSYGGWGFNFGEVVQKPETIEADSSIRLYSLSELTLILKERGMEVISSFGDYDKTITSDDKHMQLLVYSIKR